MCNCTAIAQRSTADSEGSIVADNALDTHAALSLVSLQVRPAPEYQPPLPLPPAGEPHLCCMLHSCACEVLSSTVWVSWAASLAMGSSQDAPHQRQLLQLQQSTRARCSTCLAPCSQRWAGRAALPHSRVRPQVGKLPGTVLFDQHVGNCKASKPATRLACWLSTGQAAAVQLPPVPSVCVAAADSWPTRGTWAAAPTATVQSLCCVVTRPP